MARALPSDGAWDLVVVGAGPAGAAAALGALAVDPDLRVLLLDRSDFPRDKSCGDGIAPHVVDVLAGVGAADVVDGWTPIRRLELSRGPHEVAGLMARAVWVVPRAVLDARLVDRAVGAGAVLHRHRVGGLARHRDRVVIDGTVTARVVVGADGAHSAVRSGLGADRVGARALAIRGYAPTPAARSARSARQVIRYGERRQPSYAWSFDRGDGLSNVGYGELIGGEDAPPTRALLLEQLELLLPGSVAEGRQWRGHHLPLSGWRWHQPDGPVLLAGDAAGLVNPMTGEGIFYAVATGVLAGRAAAHAVRSGSPGGAGAAYRTHVRRRLAGHLRHTWSAARLSRHRAVVVAGIRAARRDREVFDDLVELGLGDGRITPRLASGLASDLTSGLVSRLVAPLRHSQR
ncbi:NAD(P)/FAD-dependent oxidoreductase [Nocardioides sp. MAHUQ-72]|uniref:NAD(P)/FAD-dependent oxidoreductase n=1 Tax=unclassified Nocardioides TaxID=2615069 RepID=UPI0036217EF6